MVIKLTKKQLRALIREQLDELDFETKHTLNPEFWNQETKQLDPEISSALIEIAMDFMKASELSDVEIKDITFTGSLANYNYSQYSDIDLHIIVDFNNIDDNKKLVKEYFDARKNLWNLHHEILIDGYEVEIYIQDLKEPHVSSGVYSILHNKWLNVPKYSRPFIDYDNITKKAMQLQGQINHVTALRDAERYEDAVKCADLLKTKVRKFRKSGLEKEGEFSVENLTFKLLRRNGYLDKLNDLKQSSYDKMMSIG